MSFNLNSSLFLADLSEPSERARTLKRTLGRRWQAPMAAEQRELHRVKQRITELCALRAFGRGKLHRTHAPRDADADWNATVYHRRIWERLAPSYTLTLEKSA